MTIYGLPKADSAKGFYHIFFKRAFLNVFSEEEDCVSLGKETPEGSEAGEIEETKKGFNYFIGNMCAKLML